MFNLPLRFGTGVYQSEWRASVLKLVREGMEHSLVTIIWVIGDLKESIRKVKSRIYRGTLQSTRKFIDAGHRELLPHSDLVQGFEVDTHLPPSVLFPTQHQGMVKAAG